MKKAVLLSIALAALALACLTAYGRDPTVGSCTRKDEFNRAFKEIDSLVIQLTGAAERKKPVAAAMIAKKYGQGATIENLIRYREKDMRHVFLYLLKSRKWCVRTRALYGLKMTGDIDDVPAVKLCLRDKDPKVREMAANCLQEIASIADVEELGKYLEKEKDPFVASSLTAAIGALKSGKKPYAAWTETLTGLEGAKRVEWAWVVKGKTSFNKHDFKDYDIPAAESFDWPISWYEGSLFATFPRKSFAAGGTHCGEDMAWFREGCSYYCVADGVVRQVQGAGGDWGFLTIIEHRLPTGEYVCALYGHGAWDILVKPGEKVTRGEKIGTEGLSCSVENGGYGSHLHFGIADGPARRPKGYEKGASVEVDIDGEKVKGTVVRLGYDASKKDTFGYPHLAATVKLPDGTEKIVSIPGGDLQGQVSWIVGYKKDCEGWLDPYKFIKPRRKNK